MNDRTFQADRARVLDDPRRRIWLPPDEVLSTIGLQPGAVVADIGAGTGYFALPFAEAVGPTGKVFAVDFQPAMLEIIAEKLSMHVRLRNVDIRSGSAASTMLDRMSVDVVFMANLWHELDEVSFVLAEAKRVLRKDGRLFIVDWRADVPSPPGPPAHHRVALRVVTETLGAEGWHVIASGHIGSYSHFIDAEPNKERKSL